VIKYTLMGYTIHTPSPYGKCPLAGASPGRGFV
jgi:hypothetical protein